jgi:putative Mg2+ transporter-C (MgtC) family protein
MRTYALVCVASCILTVVNAYPHMWFGGLPITTASADPTRVIQGIMSGIGFLGAGMIVRDGFSIKGLSTAASVWLTSAIGVVIGLGFYLAAILAAVMTIVLMSLFRRIGRALPHYSGLHLTLTYPRAEALEMEDIRCRMESYGFDVIDWSVSVAGANIKYTIELQGNPDRGRKELAAHLCGDPAILKFHLSPVRG